MPEMMIGPVDELRDGLVRLIRAPERATPLRIWRALTQEERCAAAHGLLANDEEGDRGAIIRTISRLRRIREKTVISWPDSRIVETVAQLPLDDWGLASNLLNHLHLNGRRPLLQDYLDTLEVEHEAGRLVTFPDPGPTAAAVRLAADRLATLYPIDEVVTYFLTILALRLPIGAGLAGWLADLSSHLESEADATRRAQATTDAGGEVAGEVAGEAGAYAEEGEPERQIAPEETEGFTTLDRQLVRIIIDVAQGIEGALSRDQLDDLIQEVVELNSSRHQSYFHAGLRDAIFDEDSQWRTPARNESRERWYWAGYIQGLARAGRWAEIVRVFDEHPVVHSLGERGRGPSEAATVHILTALGEADRLGEIPTFLRPRALAESRLILTSVADLAEGLLREDNATEARALYDLLGEAIEVLTAFGFDRTERVYLEIRRRRAHCYRQLGQLSLAGRLLRELLEEEPDPDIRAMVLTDLGLIDGGFLRLADLRLPLKKDKLAAFRDALARGVPRFEEALAIDAKYSAHAHYCLGILELAKEEYEAAARHLEVALSVFEGEPSRYRSGGILVTGRLYLGLAISLYVTIGRMQRAAVLIREAIAQGARVPRYLISDLLTAFSMRSDELAQEIMDQILTALGSEALDILVESEIGSTSLLMARGLFERGRDESRGEATRARDLQRALPILLEHGELDDAALALDALEDLALRGVERDYFVALLEGPEGYSPAWELDDARWARVRCLEAAGDYEAAARILTDEFYQVLTRDRNGGEIDAIAALERIRSYGLGPEYTNHLAARLEALRQSESGLGMAGSTAGPGTGLGDEGEELDLPIAVRILYVGGDERQARYDQQIRDELRERDPELTIRFHHPGWSANWGDPLQEILRQAVNYDGIVISRLNRTEFGRRLRKGIAIPWRGCGGTGKRAIIASILAVAREARRESMAKIRGGGSGA